jgi:hypothetical protein
LQLSVKGNKTIEEIATEHQRTYGSIFAKLKGFAFDYHNENKTIEQIKLYTGLSESVIRDVISEKNLSESNTQMENKSNETSSSLSSSL